MINIKEGARCIGMFGVRNRVSAVPKRDHYRYRIMSVPVWPNNVVDIKKSCVLFASVSVGCSDKVLSLQR